MDTNDKYISIPPYLSTSWKHVRSLHMKDKNLIVTLVDNSSIEIPNVSPQVSELVFASHAAYLQQQSKRPIMDSPRSPEQATATGRFDPINAPGMSQFRFGVGNMEQFASAMQHDPSQASTPNLPPEILEKIVAVARVLAPDDLQGIPQAEPHCNCIHCQIARAIHKESDSQNPTSASAHPEMEEEICVTELTFQDWEIVKTGDNLYSVTNPLDPNEKYTVFLGNPIGCTCGQENCEHVIAVLRS